VLRFGRDSRSAQPWLRPPRLRTLAEEDAGEERHASWLELFFDLVFVVAIAELSHELLVNHTLNGFAIFAALFVPVFVAWQGFSFYADRFDTDDVFFRVCMLAAMLAVAALAKAGRRYLGSTESLVYFRHSRSALIMSKEISCSPGPSTV
jgi:low temperature requirement protein LtrA